MNYTKEQLLKINNNLKKVNIRAYDILKSLEGSVNIKHKEIAQQAKLSAFITDKCVSAFVACGLIEMSLDGSNKCYNITEEGKKFLKVNGEEK